ncbi:DUF6282 family protein [Alteribacillus sp. JSM 102045]|uniref:DUF6282 family protein n=1 Tax=Alteribacillus sp. JSM 102045 TaxID=1562101 RepID=UPI0035C0385E
MNNTETYHPLLKGGYELHVHSSPSIFPRKQTDWELVEEARRAGMNGLVLKAHEGSSYDRAYLIREKYPEMDVYGGLVCNIFTGGLSPHAVDMALQMGAKVVWMPTISAAQHQKYFAHHQKDRFFNSKKSLDYSESVLRVMDDSNNIKEEVKKIVSLIAEYDAVLATGHLAPNEVGPLVAEAKKAGVTRILIQHADLGIAQIPLEMQLELVREGCIIEKCYLACSEDFNNLSAKEMANSIKYLGSSNCVLVTDYGQEHNVTPIKGLSRFITELVSYGVTEQEITSMIKDNPKSLLK